VRLGGRRRLGVGRVRWDATTWLGRVRAVVSLGLGLGQRDEAGGLGGLARADGRGLARRWHGVADDDGRGVAVVQSSGDCLCHVTRVARCVWSNSWADSFGYGDSLGLASWDVARAGWARWAMWATWSLRRVGRSNWALSSSTRVGRRHNWADWSGFVAWGSGWRAAALARGDGDGADRLSGESGSMRD